MNATQHPLGEVPVPGKTVLIVGAGPTGLTLANALAVHDINFDIVEAKAVRDPDSKALALGPTSLYSFELLGLRSKIGKQGVELRRAVVHWHRQRIAAVDFRRASARWGTIIAQAQATTEQDLESALSDNGGHVERATRLIELETAPYGVFVSLTKPQGPSRRFYDYVVGCDGKHSVVAQAMQATFTTTSYRRHFLLGDFPMQLDEPNDDAAAYHVWDDLFIVLVSRGKGLWRVVIGRDGPAPKAAVDASYMARVVTERLGPHVKLGSPVWLSSAPMYQRVADRMCRGRLILAGDAAHLFSPIGGTGMNTGIQDAVHLAWQLALTVREAGAPNLLLSYEVDFPPTHGHK